MVKMSGAATSVAALGLESPSVAPVAAAASSTYPRGSNGILCDFLNV